MMEIRLMYGVLHTNRRSFSGREIGVTELRLSADKGPVCVVISEDIDVSPNHLMAHPLYGTSLFPVTTAEISCLLELVFREAHSSTCLVAKHVVSYRTQTPTISAKILFGVFFTEQYSRPGIYPCQEPSTHITTLMRSAAWNSGEFSDENLREP
jgi:hypothetical protein